MLDYDSGLMGKGFVFMNPNAKEELRLRQFVFNLAFSLLHMDSSST